MKGYVTMAHGDGGEAAHKLLHEIILPAFRTDPAGSPPADAAVLAMPEGKLAVTTDSFVVKPLFFPGGNIGKLAVAGTVNDLAVSGAVPLYITVSFILEEGLPLADLRLIAESIAEEAAKSSITVVAGDTKVVEKGAGDVIYINTTGIGAVPLDGAPDPRQVQAGDAVIVTGTIGDHGIAILAAREELGFMTKIQSDCASLARMLQAANGASGRIRMMRDPTRGGVATALVEICEDYGMTIEVDETLLPVRPEVEGACELFGFDPLYLANEGKALLVLPQDDVPAVLAALHHFAEGRDAQVIGKVTETGAGRLLLKTPFGSTRRLYRLSGSMLPRIC